MAHETGEAGEAMADPAETTVQPFLPFRKPEKFKSGDDSQLFIKRMNLFFAAANVQSTVPKECRFCLTFRKTVFALLS